MTSGDMKQAASTYINNTNMMDICAICDKGIYDKTVEELKNIDGVEAVMPAYETDILCNIDDGQSEIRVQSINPSAYDSKYVSDEIVESDNNDYLNRLILVDGK